MKSPDARKKVEATFEKFVLDADGCLDRKDFLGLLKMLGLKRQDAEELMSKLDPKCQDRLPYKDFLDFIFGSTEQAEADAENTARGAKTSEESASTPPADNLAEETAALLAALATAEKEANISQESETKTSEDASLFAALAKATEEAATLTPDALKAQDKSAASPTEESGNISSRERCSQCGMQGEVFQDPLDPTDLEMYCEKCWIEQYANNPHEAPDLTGLSDKLVVVHPSKVWKQSDLSRRWRQAPIPNWPPYASPTPAVKDAQPVACPPSGDPKDIPANPGQAWVDVRVHVVPDLVGPHARQCTRSGRPYRKEVLAGRYRIDGICGSGHFTRAFKATDLVTSAAVCVKKHNSLTVEVLTDMMALSNRLEAVDPVGEFFPRLVDQFFDMNGYTVEAMVEGTNCMEWGIENPGFFKKMSNLRHVALGSLKGLQLLSRAGVVHCDLKPDNIMWTQASTPDGSPLVRIVDFGCARLDSRHESGRNWSLSEGGAGHLGKWAPEMALRLPITEKADVWGLAVSLLELHSGRKMWSDEDDTIETILAQALGLLNARDGLPSELLRRSPLDITRLYSPAPAHFPCYRISSGLDAKLEEMRPTVWGLGQVLGHSSYWDQAKTNLADFVVKAMEMDPEKRPSAAFMLNHAFIVESPAENKVESTVETQPEAEQKVESTVESHPAAGEKVESTVESQPAVEQKGESKVVPQPVDE